MKFDLVTNLPTTNCLIYIDKFRNSQLRHRYCSMRRGK